MNAIRKTIIVFVAGGLASIGLSLTANIEVPSRILIRQFIAGGAVAAGGLWIKKPRLKPEPLVPEKKDTLA